jgi:hypothetical protein
MKKVAVLLALAAILVTFTSYNSNSIRMATDLDPGPHGIMYFNM